MQPNTFLALMAISASTFARAIPHGTGPLFDPNYRGDTNTTIPNLLSTSSCVYIATDPTWAGDKTWGCALANICCKSPIPSYPVLVLTHSPANIVPEFLNQVSSLGPDQGAGMCTLFE